MSETEREQPGISISLLATPRYRPEIISRGAIKDGGVVRAGAFIPLSYHTHGHCNQATYSIQSRASIHPVVHSLCDSLYRPQPPPPSWSWVTCLPQLNTKQFQLNTHPRDTHYLEEETERVSHTVIKLWQSTLVSIPPPSPTPPLVALFHESVQGSNQREIIAVISLAVVSDFVVSAKQLG